MFNLQKRADRPLLTSSEVKSVLELVMHDQPTIYYQADDGTRKEVSQQEVVQVVICRIADELGIHLEVN